MKFFTNKKTINKIILVLVTLIIFNFICPTYQVRANWATDAIGDVAGMLLSPVRTLIVTIIEGLYTVMQKLVIGVDDKWDNTPNMILSPRINIF